MLREWWKRSEHLYIKYNDGYLNTNAGIPQAVFYPAWWLKQGGYENGPSSYGQPLQGRWIEKYNATGKLHYQMERLRE